MTGLWQTDWGFEITESIVIGEGEPEAFTGQHAPPTAGKGLSDEALSDRADHPVRRRRLLNREGHRPRKARELASRDEPTLTLDFYSDAKTPNFPAFAAPHLLPIQAHELIITTAVVRANPDPTGPA